MDLPIEYNQAFLTYLSTQGDIAKAAAFVMCDEAELAKLAREHNWAERYDKLQAIRAEKGVEAMARELNRTVNYVQAVQLRQLLDRVIIGLGEPGGLEKALMVPAREGGEVFSTKPLEGLAKALETTQRMTYMALGDMITEREASEERNAGAAALGVLRMMAAKGGLHVEKQEVQPQVDLNNQLDDAEEALEAKWNEPVHQRSRESRIMESLSRGEKAGQVAPADTQPATGKSAPPLPRGPG